MLGLVLFIAYWFTFILKKYEENLFILFLLVTSCFQFVPVSIIELDPVISKPYDWVSLIILLHLICRGNNIPYKKYLTYPVRIYLVFLVLLALYSLFVLHIETKVIVSVFRLHLFIISPILFTSYDYKTIQGAIKWICLFTVVASALFILQAVTGKQILSSLQSDDAASKKGSGDIVRYYNLPYFTIFALGYYARKLFDKFNFTFFFYAVIVFLAIVVSFNRNTLIVAILALIAVYYHNRKVRVLNLSFLVVLAWIITLPFSGTKDSRLDSGFKDLKNFDQAFDVNHMFDMKPSDVSDLSTTQFRALHFYERFAYVTGRGVSTTLTGIGLVNEQSSIKNKLNFSVGLINEKTSEIVQIDTADIIWSLLLLQTGLVGIAVFIAVHYTYARFFLKHRKYTMAYLSGIYVCALMVTSFFSIEIMFAPVMVFVAMLYALTCKGADDYAGKPKENYITSENEAMILA